MKRKKEIKMLDKKALIYYNYNEDKDLDVSNA